MLTLSRPPIANVVQQHREDSSSLRSTRQVLVRAPHVRLRHLRRLDDRIAAHLDGLAVAGPLGARLCEEALESPGVGEVFAAGVLAIESRQPKALSRLLSLAEADAVAERGLLSAFGWVSASSLRGITRELLVSRSAFHRQVGLAACGMHRVDPGPALVAAAHDSDAGLRRRALRLAGELGRRDLIDECLRALSDDASDDGSGGLLAARSALLLGDREASVARLFPIATSPGPCQRAAMDLVLKVLEPAQAHALLRALAREPVQTRALIHGVGVAGDVHYVPWLMQQMTDTKFARLAGESFSAITGLDLAALDLDTRPPQDGATGPNDDPSDDDIAMDADDSLPWPDPQRISAWWQINGAGFTAGVRTFMGRPAALPHCHAVLADGCQRQRRDAALYLSLLKPGSPLFNTAAPAWRQARWLATSTT